VEVEVMEKKVMLGIMLTLLLIGTLTLAFNIQPVKASGTIYIRADGSIDPPDAPISTVDNITYTLTGNITSDVDGIVVERSNIIVDGAGFTLQGTGAYDSKGINLTESTNVIIQNTTIKNFYYGIYLWRSSSNTITGNNIANNEEGIYLWFSDYNSIVGNNVTNNQMGIDFVSSSTHNSIVENNLRGNWNGVVLYGYSSKNTVTRNNMANNNNGILLNYESHSNSISENTITNSTYAGIWLSDSGNNIICANNIVNNSYGVKLTSSFGLYNIFYHNDFIDNVEQAYGDYVSFNIWDDGYLSGGNYWSDYIGVDEKSGPYQNQTGSDGIGDTPYGPDRYPLMNPWTPTPPMSYIIKVPIDLPTIKEAINVAGIGDTIFVYSGTYYERLGIRKPLLLIGEDPATTIIDGGGEGSVISIGANDVVIQNFTIRNSGRDYSDYGISIDNYDYGNALIRGNIITNNGGWGIYFYATSNNTVLENNITNNSNGIILYSSRNNTISGNDITSNSGNGVQFSESGDNNVFENDIGNNSDCGIAFYTTSSANTITGNNLTKNEYGVYLKQAYNNKFYHNNFINNPNQVLTDESVNFWDDGYPSGGNYWGDYTGNDMKSGPYQNVTGSDGIGDTSYVIDAGNVDNYPLMKPYVPFENQTVYIRADGSVDPSGAPILRRGDLYTLTSNITSNADGIVIERSNITIDGNGYLLQGVGASGSKGISISAMNNVTIKNMNIDNFYSGIWTDSSSNNSIAGNNIRNSWAGIQLVNSFNNSISGNDLIANTASVYLFISSNNTLYHNNFGDWMTAGGPVNTWDNGYPSGGNYWSYYTGQDLHSGSNQNQFGSDGIGDTVYTTNANNADHYPLMGPFRTFNAGTWNNASYNVDIVSISNITNFNFNATSKTITFDVEGQNGTTGFCRVTIPKSLLWVEDGWTILVGDQPITDYRIIPDENYTYLYLTYNHSTKTVIIQGTHVIPEFTSFIIPPLLMLTTLIATILLKKKRKTKPQLP
jgi:parallel beta-helix repeat protein